MADGALSRPALEEALEREQARIVGGERSAGLIVCDIDYFKQLNDCHGHTGGDQALRSVVERIRQRGPAISSPARVAMSSAYSRPASVR